MSGNSVDALNEIVIFSNIKDHQMHFNEILNPELYSVYFVEEEIDILQFFNEKFPSLIILDTMMSNKDCFEVFHQLKAHHNTQEIPILFIVSNDDQLSKEKFYKSGVNDIIFSPFSKEEISFKVNHNLRLFNLQKRNEQLEKEIITIKESEIKLKKSGITLKEPLQDNMEIGLDGFFNVEDLQKLQSQFANAFGVASIITDPHGMPITQPSNFSNLCQYIIRKTEKGLTNNNQSEAKIGFNYSDNHSIMHSLNGGLFDAGAKITVGGKHVANWLIGQIRDESADFVRLKEYTKEIGIEENTFKNISDSIKAMPLDQFNKIAEVLFTIAKQVTFLPQQNNHFIDKNLQEEDALIESEELFRTILYSIGDGVITTDTEGRIKIMNPIAESLTGWTQQEAYGKPLEEVFKIIHEETRAQVEVPVRKVLREGIVVGLANHTVLISKDGKEYPIADSGAPVRKENGEILGVIMIIRDQSKKRIGENALKESELKFRSLFENSSVGISVTSIDGVMKMNKAFIEMLGYSESELFNKKWQEITHPDDIERNIHEITLLKKGSSAPSKFEKRYIHKSGKIIWADVSIILQKDSNNEPAYFITSVNDITKRKQAEEAILNEKQLLRTLIDNLPVTIYVKDDKGRKMVANKADLEVVGALSEEEVLGKTDLETFNDEIGKRGYEDDLKVIHSGEAVINREEVFVDKNGSHRWLLTSKIPLMGQGGNIIGLVGIGRDITDQKKANETILKFSKSIEQSPSTIVITDVSGNIEYVNPKFTDITGYTLDEVIGKNPSILKSGLMSDEIYKNLWETISSGEVWRGEFQNKKKNGDIYWEWATMTSIKNEEGVITNYISIKEDISSRKKMEADLIIAKEKAEENDRLKSAFLANMSHEIRTPLNSIIGFSELLADPDFVSDERFEFARIISNSGNNLLSILSDIMDISKIEAGQVEVRKYVFSVKRLFQDIYSEFRIKAISKGIDLQISPALPAEDIFIESDQTKIRQVLINFVGNALKFTERGSIKIGIEITGKSIRFNVKDTGIGIDEQYHSRIFERFRQLEGTYTRKYGGNGLGLAISKSLIEMLGGTLKMESEKGKGSLFYFILHDVVI